MLSKALPRSAVNLFQLVPIDQIAAFLRNGLMRAAVCRASDHGSNGSSRFSVGCLRFDFGIDPVTIAFGVPAGANTPPTTNCNRNAACATVGVWEPGSRLSELTASRRRRLFSDDWADCRPELRFADTIAVVAGHRFVRHVRHLRFGHRRQQRDREMEAAAARGCIENRSMGFRTRQSFTVWLAATDARRAVLSARTKADADKSLSVSHGSCL